MTQHTLGPWKFYDDSNDGKTNRIEIVAIGKTVARICHSVPAEDLPNARLIAAAPELLDALRIAVRQNSHDMQMTGDELRICEAAIAKATGRAA